MFKLFFFIINIQFRRCFEQKHFDRLFMHGVCFGQCGMNHIKTYMYIYINLDFFVKLGRLKLSITTASIEFNFV